MMVVSQKIIFLKFFFSDPVRRLRHPEGEYFLDPGQAPRLPLLSLLSQGLHIFF